MKLLVIEYAEGCGYNAQVTNEVGSFWWSRYPYNRARMQSRIEQYTKQFPGIEIVQQMVYSPEFTVPNTACSGQEPAGASENAVESGASH